MASGGHIADEVVERRYYRGVRNFFELYSEVCDSWMLIDNTNDIPVLIAKKNGSMQYEIEDEYLFEKIQQQL